jgi:ATP-dependent helicase/nuclease subunit A
VNKRDKDCWYDLIADGLGGILTETTGDGGRTVWRLKNESTVVVKAEAAKIAEVEAASLPDWAVTPAPAERRPPQLLPSRIGMPAAAGKSGVTEQPPLGPQALADNKRFSRGRIVHTLLQYLPSVDAAERDQAARAFVGVRGADLPEAMREEIVAESLAIVRDRTFAPLFAPGSLGEVPLVAKLGEGENAQELSGQIDRLAILDDGLLILDYKTNRPPPSEPESVAPGYIAQLAAYRLALRGMFPDLPLRAAIIWTDGPKLMEIPSTLLDAAERRIVAGPAQP